MTWLDEELTLTLKKADWVALKAAAHAVVLEGKRLPQPRQAEYLKRLEEVERKLDTELVRQ